MKPLIPTLLAALLIPAQAAPPPLGTLPPVRAPEDNPQTPEKIELGRLLFFEARLAGGLTMHCGMCHEPGLGWGDGMDLSRGYPGTLDWRNTQTVLNAAHYDKLEWDGGQPSLEAQAASAVKSAISQNGDISLIEERLAQTPEYVRRFKRVFGADAPLFTDAVKAIAAFERTLVSKNVPFDKYLRGNKNAISESAKHGLKLFQGKAACIQCHNGPLASDQNYHATGVPDSPKFSKDPLWQITLRYQHAKRGVPEELYRGAYTDLGLYYLTKKQTDKKKFRTPSLRELKYTAPYMHNGYYQTLEEVIDFYNKGGGETLNKTKKLKPLKLTKKERKDLLAFLETLNGDEIIISSMDSPPYKKIPAQP